MLARRFLPLAALPLLAFASLATAQPADTEQRIEVGLSNFKFDPNVLRLQHGGHYVLHLVNHASGGHNFVAPDFFSAATIAPADAARVTDGKVSLSGGETADIHLTAPAQPGSFEVHCSHFGHEVLGMQGRVEVQ